MTQLRLHYAPDNASMIVRITLEELGLPYEVQLVDRRRREQDSAAYRSLNPAGHIPVLETQNGPISETAAILLWLSETHGAMAPAPLATDRGAFLKWLFFMSNTVQAGLRMRFYPDRYVGPDPEAQAALRHHMQTALSGHFDVLNQQAEAGHPWLNGTDLSVLDIYVCACLRWSALYPDTGQSWFRLSAYPALKDLAQRVEQRPACRRVEQAEGLGPLPFSRPQLAQPSEGSAF